MQQTFRTRRPAAAPALQVLSLWREHTAALAVYVPVRGGRKANVKEGKKEVEEEEIGKQ